MRGMSMGADSARDDNSRAVMVYTINLPVAK